MTFKFLPQCPPTSKRPARIQALWLPREPVGLLRWLGKEESLVFTAEQLADWWDDVSSVARFDKHLSATWRQGGGSEERILPGCHGCLCMRSVQRQQIACRRRELESLQGRIRAAETRGGRSDSFGRRRKRLGRWSMRRARGREGRAERLRLRLRVRVLLLFGAAVCSSAWVKRDITTVVQTSTIAHAHILSPDLARAGSRRATRSALRVLACLARASVPLHAGTPIARAPRCCAGRGWRVPCVKQGQPSQPLQAAPTCQTQREDTERKRFTSHCLPPCLERLCRRVLGASIHQHCDDL